MHKIRGLEPSVLDDADVPCCLWMRHSALDRAADQHMLRQRLGVGELQLLLWSGLSGCIAEWYADT